jgi:hypothetical protein
MASSSFFNAESVIIVGLIVGFLIWFLIRRLAASRPGFNVLAPVAVAFGLRMVAMAGVGAAGLNSTLRGGDETTFVDLARALAATPFGHGFLPHGPYQLQTVMFAIEMKLFNLSTGGMRIIQVGLALTGVVLVLAAVNDLAGGRAARLTAWILAFEPGSIFFNSGLHKEPLMELAAGLVVFGGTMIWRRLDVRGIFICGLGGLIAVETRSYAGWFLVAAAVFVLLHAALRNLDRPFRAMPVVYAVVIAVFVATPVILQASSKKNLAVLQQSQTANAFGIGEATGGANGDNLALEQVDFSSRGAILKNLPKRIEALILEPYPWQLGDTSQRFGAIGTLFAYAILLLLLRYAWLSKGQILPRAAPVLYPLFFLLIAYSLSVGNAGTGFRYRTHLITLTVAAMAILREQVATQRAESKALADEERAQARPSGPAGDPVAIHLPVPV